MVTIQAQRTNGQWFNVATCKNSESVISNRLKDFSSKYDRVRAIDSHGRLIDLI
jgi:hypothetical protein